MARHIFGGGVADWTFGPDVSNLAELLGAINITFWNAETGGTQHTDLLDMTNAAISSVTSSDGTDGRALGQIPQFKGPDNVTEMWASADSGPRALMHAGSTAYVATTGDTMTGTLVLSADPTNLLEAATKGYVDNHVPPAVPATNLTGTISLERIPAGSRITVTKTTSYPARPTARTDITIVWKGNTAPTFGGSGAVADVDEWLDTSA